MTKEEADGVLSKYYPDYLSDAEVLNGKWSQTTEHKNLVRKCEEGKLMVDTWHSVMQHIGEQLPETFIVEDWTHLFASRPCLRSCIIYPPMETAPNRIRRLMLNVSILIKYFAIYISEKDYDPVTKRYTLPLIGFKNEFDDDYVILAPLKGSMLELALEQSSDSTPRKFIYENRELDNMVFEAVDAAMSKYFPAYCKTASPFLFEPAGNFTNGENLKGETRYFECLFTDHIF